MRRIIGGAGALFTKTALIYIVCGLAAATGHAPLSWWWLSLIGFGVLFWFAKSAPGPRHMAFLGWAGGLGYFAGTLFWIVEPFLVDIVRHGWMAPFALFFLSGGLAVLWSGAFLLAGRMASSGQRLFVLVITLTAAEMLRAVLFTGFPWALIGYIWVGTPVAQIAAITGPHGLTFLTLLLVGLVPYLRGKVPVGAAVALMIAGACWGWGQARLNGTDVVISEKVVRLVQPNAAQHLKWQADMIPVFFDRLLTMTRAEAEVRPDLIIWPETSVGYRLDRAGAAMQVMAEAAGGVSVVFGANTQVDGKYRNTLAVMDETGAISQRYYKAHLVPFGEYLPFGELLAKYGIHGMAARDGAGYEAGPGPEVLNIPGIGAALPLICYELIFPRNLRVDRRPGVLLQITNDAWFGNISGPYQHLAQAQIRAIEQGLPLVRAANTGVSAVIDPLGRITNRTRLNEAAYLDAKLSVALPPTPYSGYGDWPMRLGLLTLLVGFVAWRRRVFD